MNLRRKLQQYIALNSYVEKYTNVLPAGYERLEYIESSGTQCIDLGIKGNQNTRVEIKWMYHIDSDISTSGRIIGARYTDTPYNAWVMGTNTGKTTPTSNNTTFLEIVNGASSSTSLIVNGIVPPIGNWISIVADKNTYKINGKSYGPAISTNDFETPYNLHLFAFAQSTSNQTTPTIGCGIGRCAYLKIYNNDILVLDLIPAKRNSDNVIGMYDTVSGTFLTNSGTGDFVAGPSTTDFKDALHDGLKEITAYGKAIQPAKDYLDTVIANGGTELVSETLLDTVTAKGKTQLRKVPVDYEELEYVIFDGTQIVDTGIYISQDDEIQSKFYGTTNQSWVYGTGPDNPRITCYLASTGNQRWGNVAKDATGITYNVMNTVIQNKTAFTLNGTSYAFPAGSDFTTELTLTIGNCNTSTGTPYFSGNFYYMKIYNANRKLVLNLVPAKRKFDNTIGFYNTVNNSFIVPSTGTLIAGPSIDIPSDYTRLAYLTGDGNAYIDLDISLTQEDEFELDFIMPSSSVSMQNIFGYRNSASSNAMTAMIASTSNLFVTDFNNSDYSLYRLLTSISASTAYKVITNKNSRFLYQGDTLVDSNTTVCEDTITTGNILVFNIGGSPAYTNKFTGSISKVIIKNRINLIPVKRNSDGVLGMYDTINNQFYTNAAETGAFIAGPEVQSPNNPYDIYCNNGKIVITANEANYVASNVTLGYWLRNTDGQPEASSANFYTNMMPVKPDTSYVAYGRNKNDDTLSNCNRIAWYDSTGTWIRNSTYTQGTIGLDTSPSNAAYARFHCNINATTVTQEIVDSYNWTFCEGTEEVDYVPFLQIVGAKEYLQDSKGNLAAIENLFAIGSSTYKDTQELVSGVVTRNVGVKVLNGTEAWTQMTSDRGYYTNIPEISGLPMSAALTILCSHYEYEYWTPPQSTETHIGVNKVAFNGSTSGTNGNVTIRPDLSVYDTTEKFTAFLADQYAAGTPVILIYPLATATTKTVSSQYLQKSPVTIAQSSLDNLEVTSTESLHTVPAPNYPLDIRCNNGVFKSLLPSGYDELEYIYGSSNGAYIDTGIAGNNDNLMIEVKAQAEQHANYTSFVANYVDENSNVTRIIAGSTYGIIAEINRKAADSTITNTIDITQLHVYSLYRNETNSILTVDGVVIETMPYISGTENSTNIMINSNKLNTTTQIGVSKSFYNVKIWDNSVLVRNFIPAKRKSDNKVGMYDIVSNTFFYSVGSEEFNAGNIIPKVIGTTETLVDFNGTTNLFDKDTNPYINAYVHATTGKLTQGTEQYCFCIPCKPRTTYFLFGMSNPSAWGSFTSNAINTTATTFVKGNNVLTTGPNDQYLIGLAYAGTTYDYRDTLNIVEYTDTMNTATCEDLFGVTDYKDTQEIITGTVTRNVGIKVLNGTEDWTVSAAASNLFYSSSAITNADTSNDYKPISTHFNGVLGNTGYAAMQPGDFKHGSGSSTFYFKIPNITTAAECKQWITDQYNAGTPVVIIYPLATATAETVSGQMLVTPPVSIKQASMSGLTVDTTQTNVTVPTPARPLDIYCNNGKLKIKKINYYDNSNPEYDFDGYINNSGDTGSETKLISYTGGDKCLFVKVSPNTTYTATRRTDLGSIYDRIRVAGFSSYPTNDPDNGIMLINLMTNSSTPSATFTTLSNTKWIAINVRNSGAVDDKWNQYKEAFYVSGPDIIEAQGNPETITIYSKNLFNKNGNLLHGTYNASNGSWVDNENFRTLDYIPGKPGVSYTISAQSTSSTGGNAFSVQAWDSTHTNWLGTIASSTAQSTQYASGISPAGTAYLSVSFAPSYRDINTVQLEVGPRPTTYESYGDQVLTVSDLLGFGNYQTLNYIELAGGAYFDTGYKPQNGCEVEFEFSTRTVQANGCSYLGSRSNDVGSGINCGRDGSKKIVADYFGTSTSQRYTSSSVFEDNTSYKVIFRNNTFSLYKSGTLFVSNTFTPTTQTQTNTLLINALHYGNNQITGNVETLRIKSLKVWDVSGNLVIDIVPVKETVSGKIGFYDRAINTFSNTFLGGGTITAGTIDGIVFGNSVISDSQEIINGIINKKVGVITLTGEETVGAGQAANKFYIGFTGKIPNYPRSQDWLPICTHFAGQVGSLTGSGECTSDHVCFYTNAGNLIQLYMSISGDTKSSSQFKAWLAEQYAAGTPVIVLYPIATDITENVDPQFVELTAGNSYITKESEYVESNLSVKYKKLK